MRRFIHKWLFQNFHINFELKKKEIFCEIIQDEKVKHRTNLPFNFWLMPKSVAAFKKKILQLGLFKAEEIDIALEQPLLEIHDAWEHWDITKNLPEKKEEKVDPNLEVQAELLAKDKEIFSKIQEALDMIIKGEEGKKEILFLTCLSTLLPNPLAIRIVGDPSLGKTHLARGVMSLFPSNMKIIVGGLSSKALVHRQPDYYDNEGFPVVDLNNKILWILEEKGGEAAYDVLRPIISQDQEIINFEITDKDELGRLATRKKRIKGCPSFLTTSTNMDILREMGSRVIMFSPDDSEEQTKKIIQWKAMTQKNPMITKQVQFHALLIAKAIGHLKPYTVWIPYAGLVENSMPTGKVTARREIDKIFSLIKAITLLNQYNRTEVEAIIEYNDGIQMTELKEKLIIATLDDLATAVKLIPTIIRSTMENIPEPVLEFYDDLRKKFESGTSFTANDCLGMTHGSKEYGYESIRKYLRILSNCSKLSVTKEMRQFFYQVLADNQNDNIWEIWEMLGNPSYVSKYASVLEKELYLSLVCDLGKREKNTKPSFTKLSTKEGVIPVFNDDKTLNPKFRFLILNSCFFPSLPDVEQSPISPSLEQREPNNQLSWDFPDNPTFPSNLLVTTNPKVQKNDEKVSEISVTWDEEVVEDSPDFTFKESNVMGQIVDYVKLKGSISLNELYYKLNKDVGWTEVHSEIAINDLKRKGDIFMPTPDKIRAL